MSLITDPQLTHLILSTAVEAEREFNRAGRDAASDVVRRACTLGDILWAVSHAAQAARVKALLLLSYADTDALEKVSIDILTADASPVLRHEAAYFLGTRASDNAVHALASALRGDADDLVRHEAAEALGEHRTTAARAVLLEALADPSERVRETVTIALQHVESCQ